MKWWTRAVVAVAFSCAISPTAGMAEIRYRIVDLGTLGGAFSVGEDINASGRVTGQSNTTVSPAFVPLHAFLYDNAMHDLGTLPGHSLSYGYAINDAGHVAGRSYNTTAGGDRAFYFDGSLQNLGTLGGSASQARGINNSDHVVGFSLITGDSAFHAFLYDGTMHDLGTLGGSSYAEDINDFGLITGRFDSADNLVTRGFVYDGTMHALGTLGGTHSYGRSINIGGQITGGAWTVDEAEHAYFYDGNMHDLGTLGGTTSAGWGINDSGYVVGASQTASGGFTHAFVHSSSRGMEDLNTLIDASLGWELIDARAINNAGQITGHGEIGGQRHAYLLTPVPEPATAGLAALAFFAASAAYLRSRQVRKT